MVQIETVMADLQDYLAEQGVQLTPRVREYFYYVEYVSWINDNPPSPETFLLSAIRNFPGFALLVNKLGGDSNKMSTLLEKAIIDGRDTCDSYKESGLCESYSCKEKRELGIRTMIIDNCVDFARAYETPWIREQAVIYACMASHDNIFPVFDNGQWTDERLHTEYNTLSHIIGRYFPSMWVKFSDIRLIYSFENKEFDYVKNISSCTFPCLKNKDIAA